MIFGAILRWFYFLHAGRILFYAQKDVDISRQIGLLCNGLAMSSSTNLVPWDYGEKNMSNQTTFEVKNPKATATYGQIQRIAMHFSKAKNCPKDIKFGTVRGHFLAKLNDTKSPLTQGQVSKILSLKSLPKADLTAMRAYKKLVSLG